MRMMMSIPVSVVGPSQGHVSATTTRSWRSSTSSSKGSTPVSPAGSWEGSVTPPSSQQWSASPSSPSTPWDVSLDVLSWSLSQICRGPAKPNKNHRLGRSKSEPDGVSQRKPLKSVSSMEAFPPIVEPHGPEEDLNQETSQSSSVASMASSVSPLETPVETPVGTPAGTPIGCEVLHKKRGKCKKVRVRHELSTKRLQEQLKKVCGGGSKSDVRSTAEPKPHRPHVRRTSVVDRFRHKVQLSDNLNPEDLVIKYSAGALCVFHYLDEAQLETVASFDLHIDDDDDVAVDKALSRIMCVVYDNDILDIKEYPAPYVHFLISEDSPAVPIMCEDSERGTWRLVLPVPGAFAAPNALFVKTVDDVLWVHFTGAGAELRLSVDLPYNVDGRRVRGIVTHRDQLVLTAPLQQCGTQRALTM